MMLLDYWHFDSEEGGGWWSIEAEITLEHPQSSYGQPVIVMPCGDVLDGFTWFLCSFRVKKITCDEQKLFDKWIAQNVRHCHYCGCGDELLRCK